MIDFNVFDIMCRHGLANDAEILAFSRHIAEMNRINRLARAQRRKKEARQKRYERSVENYAASMAPVFGIEAGLPVGDRA